MRPIGAILFGEIGDRMVGRKHALMISIMLITIPSVLMGILPGYNSWGMAAPIVLVILRMLQGLSVGGQLAGSYVISIEQSSSRSRGFRGSVCDASSVSPILWPIDDGVSMQNRFLTIYCLFSSNVCRSGGSCWLRL
jgi:MHS family proline/betaine transporter-like MFS transporter